MRLFSSAWIVHVAVLAFTGCSFAGKIRHASLAARQTPAELVEPSLDQFLNQTVLDTLKTIPHVGAEWADEVTNTTFLANLKVVDDLGLRGLSPS